MIRAVLWLTTTAALALTFVWPYAVSADPANETFKIAAMATFFAFFAALVAALIIRCKDLRTSS